MKLPANDDDIKAWVDRALAALDDTPRVARWRTNALGMPRTVAMATAPRMARLDISVPVGEWRIIKDVAQSHGLGPRQWVRKALATMCLVEGVNPDMVPWLAGGGIIEP